MHLPITGNLPGDLSDEEIAVSNILTTAMEEVNKASGSKGCCAYWLTCWWPKDEVYDKPIDGYVDFWDQQLERLRDFVRVGQPPVKDPPSTEMISQGGRNEYFVMETESADTRPSSENRDESTFKDSEPNRSNEPFVVITDNPNSLNTSETPQTMVTSSSSSDYNHYYSSSSSDEDSKASAVESKSKANHVEEAKPSIPLNDRRVTYAKLMKRKVEDDEAEDRQRRKDRVRRKILAAEEKHRFVDGVPSDSDYDASEDEPMWVPQDRKIKTDQRTRELKEIAKQVEAELEAEHKAEDDSDTDDLDIHPDFINGTDSDSDEEENSENDDEPDKSDDFDESDE
ncbi:transcription initiation factor TFIID subunit 11-like [Papaver somniferum]|uniref:transcription initiation factor TFIID subunit 11-like n=1 Tax=Papaver somniferum TaxID=3469 RepID=UPI000E7008A7|nr:transcription initiation factor TFIID subunit 11-like [Papaver somniferum]